MKIGVDILGGDFAPAETMAGAISASTELPADTLLTLIGDSAYIQSELDKSGADLSRFEIIHAPEMIGMGEHPTKAIQQKTNSSISVGFHLLKEGRIDAFASAGNTGAMLVGALFSVKAVPGILRPAISTLLPKENGGWGLLLDVGVNADCKPEVLQQFAILGSLYAKHILHIDRPKVALMSIGEEEEKGNLLVKEAHALIKETSDLHFIGNVEGRDLFNDKADVIVCDGFTGNVLLKEAESFYTLIKKRGINDPYFDRFNYEDYGGTPILGVNSTVIIAHGISKAKAIKNMVVLAHDVAKARLCDQIAAAFSKEAVS